jgi:hypothetical protein
MPESRSRRKAAYTPPAGKSNAAKPSPRWFVPVMVGLLVLGLAWIVVYYVSQTRYPIPGIEHFNLVIGFVILMAGFAMTTRWR